MAEPDPIDPALATLPPVVPQTDVPELHVEAMSGQQIQLPIDQVSNQQSGGSTLSKMPTSEVPTDNPNAQIASGRTDANEVIVSDQPPSHRSVIEDSTSVSKLGEEVEGNVQALLPGVLVEGNSFSTELGIVAPSDTTEDLPSPAFIPNSQPHHPPEQLLSTFQSKPNPTLGSASPRTHTLAPGAPPIALLDTHPPIRAHAVAVASKWSSNKPSSHSEEVEENPKPNRRRKRAETTTGAGRGKRKRKKRTAESEEEEKEREREREKEDAESLVKCLCGVEENSSDADGLMIECEKCQTWQHFPCMEILDNNPPAVYYCHECDPVAFQERKAANSKPKSLRSRRKSSASREQTEQEKEVSPPASKRAHPHRQSADAALIAAAFGDPIRPSHQRSHDKHRISSSSEDEEPAPPPPVKKRNTMNSRDAAYDPAQIAKSILEPGSGAMRKRLEEKEREFIDGAQSQGSRRGGKRKRRESGEKEDHDETEDERRSVVEEDDDHRKTGEDEVEIEETGDVEAEGEGPRTRPKRKRSNTVSKIEEEQDEDEGTSKPKKRRKTATRWTGRGRGKKRRRVMTEVTDEEVEAGEQEETVQPVDDIIEEEPALEGAAEHGDPPQLEIVETTILEEDPIVDQNPEEVEEEEVDAEETKKAPKKRGGARRKGKAKHNDDDDDVGLDVHSKFKGKHPNQYTYRDSEGNMIPKSLRSPQKRTSGRGKKNTLRGGVNETPLITGIEGWGLPDHLSVVKPSLDTQGPQMLTIRTFTKDGSIPETYQVQPSKIKWPTKRNGMGDLKKRCKHIMDFLQRIEVDMVQRKRKNKAMEFVPSTKVGDEDWPETLSLIQEITKDVQTIQNKYFSSGGRGKAEVLTNE